MGSIRFSTAQFCLIALAVALAATVYMGCTGAKASSQMNLNPSESPRISGNWVGTWGVQGAPKNYQQRLDCRVTALGPDKWEATFEGECGRPYKYTIQMLGRRAGDVVLFKGSVDLGEADGGVYDWIGRATAEKFVGFYTSQKYTGTFELSRPQEGPTLEQTK
jgi:hypothetical protein